MNARTSSEAPDRSRSTRRTLYHLLAGLAVIALALGTTGVPGAQAGPPVWRDEFNGTIDGAWTWLNENAGGWDLTEAPDFLRIYASAYPTGEENLLLRTGAQGNFIIETSMHFEPEADFQFAGLVLYQDGDNYLQFGRAYCDLEGTCAGNGLYFDQIADATFGDNNYATSYDSDEVFLRLEVKGRKVTAYFRGDDQDWTNLGQHTLPPQFQINGVGLTASQDYWRESEAIAADFDYFSFTGDPKPSNPIPVENKVFVNPTGFYGTEFVVRPDQDIVLRWRWGTCARGQVVAFIKALDASYVLEGQGELQGEWGKPREAPYISGCSGGERRGWAGWWEHTVGTLPVGDYTLHSTAELTHPVTDGYDSDGDGHPDLYSGTFFDTEITIHVRETLATFVAYVPGAVEGYDWPLGHRIALNVNDGEYVAEADSEQRPGAPARASRVLFETWRDDFSIEADDHIVMTDTLTGLWKDTVVTNLAVTGIDLGAGTVTGVFDPEYSNGNLSVWLYDQGGPASLEIVDDRWTATFDPLPPGTWGGATQWEWDGDGTSLDFQVPNPRFTVFPEGEWMDGYDWPDGPVSVTVAGKVDCSVTMTSAGGFFNGAFPTGCNVEVTDEVTFFDGTTTRTHTVRNLGITDVDGAANTVSGTADDGAVVHVWVHEHDETEMQLTADGGTWTADFTPFDVVDGMCGRSEIRDDQGNSTAVDWCAAEPPPPAEGLWVAAYTFDVDPGSFMPGTFPYQFELEWTVPESGTWSGQEGELTISEDADVHEGYVLLRGHEQLRGVSTPDGLACEQVEAVSPDQPMRFLFGYLPDYGDMTYEQAVAHFESVSARAVSQDWMWEPLTRHEIIPFSWDDLDSWFQYVCTFSR